jgi:membrane protease YdiL (CAAX protease family)
MEGTVQSAIPIGEFIAVTTIGSVIYTWIYKHTKSLTLMILHHWAANLAAALFVYWDTPLGRWVFFGVQLVVVIAIVVYELIHTPKKAA